MAKPASGDIRIGVSGWRYPQWRGSFYPDGMAQRNELAYAASIFNSIEINGTFYSLQRPATFTRWAQETPSDFVFAVKGPRYITHMLRLKNAQIALANFFASGVLKLGAKLGPILWQFGPDFRFDVARLEEFFLLLPHDSETASRLAMKHNDKVKASGFAKTGAKRALRHAMEIRHESFRDPAFIGLLRRFGVALVFADTVEWPLLMDLTADFVYCRLHGSDVLYASGYDDKALAIWARRVAAWARGQEPADDERVIPERAPRRARRDVFVYFDNDAKARAPADARALRSKVEALLAPGAA